MDFLSTLRNWLALPFANVAHSSPPPEEDPEPLTTFHFFPKLPEELRCLVWSFAPRHARVIQIHYLTDKEEWEAFPVESTCVGMPRTLHVSREARNETLRAYTKAFGTHIDLRRDTLFISDHTFPLRKQRRMLMDMECINGLRNLALQENVLGGIVEMQREFKRYKLCDSVAEVLAEFKQLRHFSVVLATDESHSVDDDTTVDEEVDGEEYGEEYGEEDGEGVFIEEEWIPHDIHDVGDMLAGSVPHFLPQYQEEMYDFHHIGEHGELQYEEDDTSEESEGIDAEFDFENGASTSRTQDEARLDNIEAEAFEEMSTEVRYTYATPIHLQSACKDANYNNPSDLSLAISIDKHFRRGKEESPEWKRPSFSITAIKHGLRDIDDTTPLVHYSGDYGDEVTENYPYGDGNWPRYRGIVKKPVSDSDAVDEAVPGYWDQ